jgi:hypothetical protein
VTKEEKREWAMHILSLGFDEMGTQRRLSVSCSVGTLMIDRYGVE